MRRDDHLDPGTLGEVHAACCDQALAWQGTITQTRRTIKAHGSSRVLRRVLARARRGAGRSLHDATAVEAAARRRGVRL